MSDLSVDQTALVTSVLAVAGRATLPVRRARSAVQGTAFWFDDLVAAGPNGPLVRQYLISAAACTAFDLGELVLRPELCEPPVNPDVLVMPGFANSWLRLARLGLTVLPTTGLHAHAERRGWRWTATPVDDGLAAAAPDLAPLRDRPVPAYALGHPGGSGGPLTVGGTLHRCNDNSVRWTGPMPDGLAGAPVFTPRPGPHDSADPVCAGVLLPGPEHTTLVTFDRIRLALRDLTPAAPPPPRPRWPRRA